MEADLKNMTRGIQHDTSQGMTLREVSTELQGIIEGIGLMLRRGKSPRLSPYVSVGTTEPLSHKRWKAGFRNLFIQLGTYLFENQFHSLYMDRLSVLSTRPHKTIALIANTYDTHLSFLRMLMRLDNEQLGLLVDIVPPYSINHKAPKKGLKDISLKGEYCGNLSFFILINDLKSLETAQSLGLLEDSDVVQFMVEDLHRVSSAMSDLTERNLFYPMLMALRDRLLLCYPRAGYFQKDRLHILVCEALPEINRLFEPARVKWFIFEGFESRYNHFCDLSEEVIRGGFDPDSALTEWLKQGIPIDEPFTESVLMRQFESVRYCRI